MSCNYQIQALLFALKSTGPLKERCIDLQAWRVCCAFFERPMQFHLQLNCWNQIKQGMISPTRFILLSKLNLHYLIYLPVSCLGKKLSSKQMPSYKSIQLQPTEHVSHRWATILHSLILEAVRTCALDSDYFQSRLHYSGIIGKFILSLRLFSHL